MQICVLPQKGALAPLGGPTCKSMSLGPPLGPLPFRAIKNVNKITILKKGALPCALRGPTCKSMSLGAPFQCLTLACFVEKLCFVKAAGHFRKRGPSRALRWALAPLGGGPEARKKRGSVPYVPPLWPCPHCKIIRVYGYQSMRV